MKKMLQPMAPVFLALLRAVTGLIFLQHGMQKLVHFPSGGSHPPMFTMFWFGGILEIAGGVLLIVGLYTRISGFILSGMMAVAYFMVHAPKSFFPANNGGDAAVLLCFICLYLVFAGPGALSLDGKVRR